MKRALRYAAIAALAVRLIWLFLIPAWSRITSDFPIYYTSAWAVRHGEPLMDLYDAYWFNSETVRAGIDNSLSLFGVYPPFSALLLWPLADSTPIAAKHLWTILNVGALGVIVVILARATSIPLSGIILVALLGGDALGNNFTLGQFYIMLALLMVVAVEYTDRADWLAGIATAIGVLTKVFPGLLIIYLILTRRRRACLWTIGAFAAFTALSLVAMGVAPHAVFLREALPRAIRGEILDPYNVHFNALQTLIRRAFIPDPSLNPHPIVNAPAIGFFLRSLTSLSVLLLTFLAIHRDWSTNPAASKLFHLGAIIAAVMLITPAPGTHHAFLLFPAIVSAMDRIKTALAPYLLGGIFALICSNVMGAGGRWDSGWAMLLAFPRAYLMLVLWLVFLATLGIFRMNRRPVLIGMGLVVAFASLVTAREVERWAADERDGAVLAEPGNANMMTYPALAPFGVIYSAFQDGAVQHTSSHFGKGLVSELGKNVSGCCLDGVNFSFAGVSEPAMGVDTVVAIRRDNGGAAIVERSHRDGDWQQLLRRDTVIHDPAVSPAGDKIAFAEWVDGHYRISEWSRMDGSIRTVVSGPADYRYPAYPRSGEWFYCAENVSGDWNIIRVSEEKNMRLRMTSSEANDFMPVVSSDERTLYFASDRRRGYRYTAIYKMALR